MVGREMELADLGLGYIQIMILLLKLATFISRYEGPTTPTPTIVIEEPEQNLHPKLQSMLADLFADIYNDYGFRFIIETHSEYIIRSVQNIVLQQSYRDQEELEQKNPFKVYYFPTTRAPYDMGFQPSGRFKNKFDSGFFDEAGRLHMTIIKHERRK
jgi:predicted ATPase